MDTTLNRHLTAETLSAFLDQQLSPRRQIEAREHLASCLHCRQRLDGLRRVAAGLARIDRVAPPEVLATAIRRQIALDAPDESLLGRLERRGLASRRITSHVGLGFALVLALSAIGLFFANALERQRQSSSVLVPVPPSTVTVWTLSGRTFLREQPGRWREAAVEEAPRRRVDAGSREGERLLVGISELRDLLEAGDVVWLLADGEAVELYRGRSAERGVDAPEP